MKIAIAGYGVEGEENYKYWSADPSHDITIVDQKQVPDKPLPADAKTYLAEDAFSHLEDFDMVIRTAGLSPYKITTNGTVWSATNEFFDKCPADIIGVTGTKGKGTTSSFIASILRAAGKTVHLVGNIGQSAIEALPSVQPTDVVVYELSSFQLWDIQFSPKTAVVLFIEPEHLDVHKDMDDYVAAKANITKFQTPDDILIFNADNGYVRSIAEGSQARKVGSPGDATTHIRDGYFYNVEQKLCSVDAVQLPGEHNLSNAIAAIDAVWKYTQDATIIEAGLREFKGLPHRLAFVKQVNGVDYYDDSIATTPTSAVAALASFSQPKVIILGGSDKGADYTPLVAAIEKSSSIKAIVSIGANGRHITEGLSEQASAKVHRVDSTDVSEIVKVAASLTASGDVVIMSPAAASFDMFKNYADRGEQFVAAVNQLD